MGQVTHEEQAISREKVMDYLKVFLAAALLGLLVFAALGLQKELGTAQVVIASLGILGPVLAVVILVVLGLSPVPAEPFVLSFAAIFPIETLVTVAILGNFLAAMVEYALARFVVSAARYQKLLDSLPKKIAAFPVDSLWFLIGGRLIPAVGPKTVSLLSGFSRVGIWTYAWTSLVVSALGGAVLGLAGSGLFALTGLHA